ncbi:peptidase S10 [Rhodovastum atsumiense]|uniref:Peptidase S10 n=1 Tax=Rhodovastum atsumiense TaxID=504468 RepID=A0A5M6IL37_9PROT|nr:peptidase S10 [Rhodovastum atsumiense]
MPTETRVRFVVALAALLLACPLPALSQHAPPPAELGEARPALPPNAVSRHRLALPGRTLAFTATAGAIRLSDTQGKPQAEIAFIAYTLDDADPRTRPVAFAVNGGPGAASAWLQLGAMGPWRLAIDGVPSPSAPALPVPNAETWLDFTDLVFLDPVGAGYSRFARDDAELRRRLWSVDGDITALAATIRRWLAQAGREASPRLVVGESYGGFRGPLLARALQLTEGFGVAGLVLVSPVLDFEWRARGTDPLSLVQRLPSMAAVAAQADERGLDLEEVETYAAGPFLADLLRGPRDSAAVERLTARVAALTGLDPALVRRRAGRIDLQTFLRERAPGQVASAYDATLLAPDAAPEVAWNEQPDPVLDGLRAPLTTGMLTVYGWLGWHPDGAYRVLNDEVSQAWDWGHRLRRPDATRALREVLALDPALRVLVAHGRDDLVTPYFGTKLVLAQLPQIGAPDRVRLLVTPGGHMAYLRDDARKALREGARALLER